jgi:hypothetical protein
VPRPAAAASIRSSPTSRAHAGATEPGRGARRFPDRDPGGHADAQLALGLTIRLCAWKAHSQPVAIRKVAEIKEEALFEATTASTGLGPFAHCWSAATGTDRPSRPPGCPARAGCGGLRQDQTPRPQFVKPGRPVWPRPALGRALPCRRQRICHQGSCGSPCLTGRTALLPTLPSAAVRRSPSRRPRAVPRR